MEIRTILLGLFILTGSQANTQESSAAITVGDEVPDIQFNNVINSKNGDYRK